MARIANNIRRYSYQSIDDREVFVLIEQVRKGITMKEFLTSVISAMSFTLTEWAQWLHLSERTIQRYQKENKTFDSLQSEKILELTMLYNFGVEVFGSREDFDSWLQAKNVALGGSRPKDLLDTSYGIGLIKDELTRIEHGVLA